MSMDSRSSSALFKRAEQLKRWEESDTNRESSVVNVSRKIKFPSGCVFLASCAAGDKDEVLRLLKKGADIDTTNVDGLSALHQACIDDNLDMVEFLVGHGADVNKGDNEGWTPLHATASCGFMSIAKYLIEHGANVAAVNNDGELPVDIAESDEMEDMLQEQINDREIDADDARNEEERLMLADAKNWLQNGCIEEKIHPKTGATALHVASAKGYIKVMDILLQAGGEVDAQDFDGWTPLHAAAHWGQREACEILVEHLCDMDMKNCVGQTAFDVAENDVVRVLEDLRKKQATLSKENMIIKAQNNNKIKSPVEKKPVITDSLPIENEKKEIEDIRQKVPEVPKVEVEIQPAPTENQTRVEKKNRANRDELERISKISESNKTVPSPPAPTIPPSKQGIVEGDDNNVPSWRRTSGSFRTRGAEITKPNLSLRIGEKEQVKTAAGAINPPSRTETSQEVVLRRTQSFEADDKRGQVNKEDTKITTTTTSTTTTVSTPTSPTSPTPQQPNQVRRSFVPPVRDEESETQRKAHAKRVRETRRSTQGVTLEEIKSAEQLVKKKQQQQLQQATQQITSPEQPTPGNGAAVAAEDVVVNVHNVVERKPSVGDTVNATITRGGTAPPTEVINNLGERRPSWRLKVDNGSKFMLEDARSNATPETNVIRRTAVATPVTDTGDTTVTLPLRRSRTDDKEQDKENDVRTAQATQAVIQRRRRPKRRSTGVVHVDMDEIDPERQSEAGGGSSRDSEESSSLSNSTESGAEKSERSSRLDLASTPTDDDEHEIPPTQENGEIDYKKLYEASQLENERLRGKLRQTEEDLDTAKSQAEKNAILHKNSLSEVEKRERRAMERKLSEMEEELKQLEQLKCENQRLKDENGALIRVISKLSK